jgi:hypothetical protein
VLLTAVLPRGQPPPCAAAGGNKRPSHASNGYRTAVQSTNLDQFPVESLPLQLSRSLPTTTPPPPTSPPSRDTVILEAVALRSRFWLRFTSFNPTLFVQDAVPQYPSLFAHLHNEQHAHPPSVRRSSTDSRSQRQQPNLSCRAWLSLQNCRLRHLSRHLQSVSPRPLFGRSPRASKLSTPSGRATAGQDAHIKAPTDLLSSFRPRTTRSSNRLFFTNALVHKSLSAAVSRLQSG